jgi:hypothetical protein
VRANSNDLARHDTYQVSSALVRNAFDNKTKRIKRSGYFGRGQCQLRDELAQPRKWNKHANRPLELTE